MMKDECLITWATFISDDLVSNHISVSCANNVRLNPGAGWILIDLFTIWSCLWTAKIVLESLCICVNLSRSWQKDLRSASFPEQMCLTRLIIRVCSAFPMRVLLGIPKGRSKRNEKEIFTLKATTSVLFLRNNFNIINQWMLFWDDLLRYSHFELQVSQNRKISEKLQ